VLTVIASAAGQVASELRAASARREEQARRQQELQLLTEERLRIARELHDVVSHSIAMIGIRAGVAAHLLDREPEQAREALNAIKTASKEAMRDLRGILGVLGQAEDGESRLPAPGVDRLPELVESVRRAGVPVELDLEGELRPLPAATDLAVYRIVQEALTNVIRHAPGASARVCVRFSTEEVGLEVVDDGRAAAGALERPHGSGRGLAGMQERASAAGGRVEAGPQPGTGFAVHAWLPAPAAAA
jgi:signal transduction histidine kinase